MEYYVGHRDRRASYSQFGEDVHLLSYYGHLENCNKISVDSGLVVDVGAFRPIKLSNTYIFYKMGWRCINIDPTPGSMTLFNKFRKRDINLEIGISDKDADVILYSFGTPSVWNTLDYEAAQKAASCLGVTPNEVVIHTCRLETVLDNCPCSSQFEILLIDAEGLDLTILRSNNFEKYRPRVVMIEVQDATSDHIPSHPVKKYLEQFDYHLYSWINPNFMFVRNDSRISAS